MGKVEVMKVEFKLSDEATKRIEGMSEEFSKELTEYNSAVDMFGEDKAGTPPTPITYETKDSDFDRSYKRVTFETEDIMCVTEEDFSCTMIHLKYELDVLVEDSYEDMLKMWEDGKKA